MADRIGRISLSAYRTVTLHLAVLVAMVERWGAEKQRFMASPIGEPAKRLGWDDDPDTLRGVRPVRVPENDAADEPVQSGRHSRGVA